DREGGRLAKIVNVAFISDTEDQNACPVQRLLFAAERLHDTVDHVIGHGGVDLSGKFDKTSLKIKLARSPREIERIDRDAMATQTRTGIKRMEAEWLGGCSVNDFPDIHAHPKTQQFQFVDHRNVHASIDVLEELGQLGNSGTGDYHYFSKDRAVEGSGELIRDGVHAADDLWHIAASHTVVAGVFAIGGERYEQSGISIPVIPCHAKPMRVLFFEDWDDDRFRCARIGRAFKDDQLPGPNMGSNALDGRDYVAHVGFAVIGERGGHADQNGIHLGDAGVVACR